MVLSLGEPPGGFCDVGCCCSSFIAVFVMLFLHFRATFTGTGTSSPVLLHAAGTLPWLLRPVKASTISELYLCSSRLLFFSIYCGRYGFVRAFFTHRRFLPYASSPHFSHNLLLSRPPWEPAVLPWSLQGFMLILQTQIRPICLLDSQQSTTLIFRRIRF